MKHTDKMAFYDNMLAELKALRAKTPDRRGRNDLLFIEIVWNYYLYKNFPGQTDGLEHILKSRRFSLTEFARGCSGRFPRLGYLPFVAAVYFDRAAMYFSAAKCLKAFKDRLTDIFVSAAVAAVRVAAEGLNVLPILIIPVLNTIPVFIPGTAKTRFVRNVIRCPGIGSLPAISTVGGKS